MRPGLVPRQRVLLSETGLCPPTSSSGFCHRLLGPSAPSLLPDTQQPSSGLSPNLSDSLTEQRRGRHSLFIRGLFSWHPSYFPGFLPNFESFTYTTYQPGKNFLNKKEMPTCVICNHSRGPNPATEWVLLAVLVFTNSVDSVG